LLAQADQVARYLLDMAAAGARTPCREQDGGPSLEFGEVLSHAEGTEARSNRFAPTAQADATIRQAVRIVSSLLNRIGHPTPSLRCNIFGNFA
jgi:hypothetical protein